ncbi:MAG TPA: PH domain-containing protein [Microbacteriaceae bacterium]|nr:PH domain-containing protein [Microbacteriaceae bacterium]
MPGPAVVEADGAWHRLHPATPLLRGGVAVIAVIGIVMANLRERIADLAMRFAGVRDVPDDSGDPVNAIVRHGLIGWALLIVLAVLLVAVGLFYLSWRMHTFRVGDDEVEVRSGVVSRRYRNARLDRIQGVNLSKPLFARLFGTAKLEVSVAGQDANVELAYLALGTATGLRREILRRASGTRRAAAQARAAGGDLIGRRLDDFLSPHYDPDAPAPTSAVVIPPLRLFGAIVISGPTLVLAAIVAGVVVAAFRGHYLLLVVLAPSILAWGGMYIRRFVRSMNYSIVATAEGIRVGFGLFSTSNETIPPGRIHALEVVQPLMWRPFGWWQIRIDTAGRLKDKGAAGQHNTHILPVGDPYAVEKVLGVVVPALADPGHVALITAGMSETGAEAAAPAGQTGPGVRFTMAPRRAAWLRPFSWRRVGFILADDAVLLRTGAIWRRLTIVPLARLQSMELRQGPVRRRLGLVHARLHTVDGPVHAGLPVIDAAEGIRLFHTVARAAVIAAAADHGERWTAS